MIVGLRFRRRCFRLGTGRRSARVSGRSRTRARGGRRRRRRSVVRRSERLPASRCARRRTRGSPALRRGFVRTRSGDPYKPSALRAYEQALRTRLLPELGHMRLANVSRNCIQDLVDRMVADGLGPSTVRNAVLPRATRSPPRSGGQSSSGVSRRRSVFASSGSAVAKCCQRAAACSIDGVSAANAGEPVVGVGWVLSSRRTRRPGLNRPSSVPSRPTNSKGCLWSFIFLATRCTSTGSGEPRALP